MVLGGIALGIALIVGFRMYTDQQVNQALEASVRFEQLIEAVSENDLEPARAAASELFNDYDGTVYADQARLAMARLYMDLGRDADAAEVLEPLAESDSEAPLALVARLRLGRILLYQDKPQEVLDLLDVPADTSFVARYQEIIGDAHFALGDMEAANAAWLAALADPRSQQTVDAELIRMKLDDLPETGASDADAAGAGSSDAGDDPGSAGDESAAISDAASVDGESGDDESGDDGEEQE